MYYVFIVTILLLFFRTVYSTLQLLTSIYWLEKNRHKDISIPNEDIQFFILIPVLREQKILENTVNNFLKLDYKKTKITIFLISTEKENLDAHGKKYFGYTTMDLIKKIKNQTNAIHKKQIIKHIHYPHTTGKMVDQLNFALEQINETTKKREGVFFAIYNADSKPHIDSFNKVSALARNKKIRVFQQSSLFLSNFSDMEKESWLSEKYLKTNAVLHSRWTLAHEIPRMLRQSFFLNTYKKRFFLSHCVGHGLFLRADLVTDIGKIPDTTMTEDLFLGYNLSLLGESINPVPVLENAEAPNNFIGALKQKYVWFFGPLDHFNYERFFKLKYGTKVNSILIKWFTLQGILPAIAWLLMGWVLIAVLIYPIVLGDHWLLLVSMLIIILYGPIGYLLVMIYAKKIGLLDARISDYFWIPVFIIPTVFLHSLPPIYSIFSKSRKFFTGKDPDKPKTER
ncbi:MAG: glycosyltransferase [Parcubacteria group bacterium]|nr:glycosyltransferase [Parcubacteria group bacterium]